MILSQLLNRQIRTCLRDLIIAVVPTPTTRDTSSILTKHQRRSGRHLVASESENEEWRATQTIIAVVSYVQLKYFHFSNRSTTIY